MPARDESRNSSQSCVSISIGKESSGSEGSSLVDHQSTTVTMEETVTVIDQLEMREYVLEQQQGPRTSSGSLELLHRRLEAARSQHGCPSRMDFRPRRRWRGALLRSTVAVRHSLLASLTLPFLHVETPYSASFFPAHAPAPVSDKPQDHQVGRPHPRCCIYSQLLLDTKHSRRHVRLTMQRGSARIVCALSIPTACTRCFAESSRSRTLQTAVPSRARLCAMTPSSPASNWQLNHQ